MAVFLKLLSGPYAGQTRDVSGQQPDNFLTAAVNHGWLWQIDWQQATPKEKFLWGRSDLVCRIMAALRDGRLVRLAFSEGWQDFQFSGRDVEELKDLAGRVEDAIVYSGYNVVVVGDDDSGVVIGAVSSEKFFKKIPAVLASSTCVER